MADQDRLTGEWTPRRQAMAYQQVLDCIARARQTVVEFASSNHCGRDKALRAFADALAERSEELVRVNQVDLDQARDERMNAGGLDRLTLTEQRLARLSEYLRELADQPSPLAEELPSQSGTVRVPLGVIGVIYEPQPATTVLASAPILKAGNAVLLRGSPLAARTDTALAELMRGCLVDAGLPADSVQTLPVAERSTVRYLVSAAGLVDLVILRAGVSLARRARGDATVPLLELGPGICHLYLDATAEPTLATRVILDSTLANPAHTGSLHTVLIHQAAAATLLPDLLHTLARAGVAVHGDEHLTAAAPGILAATENHWREEHLGPELAIAVIASLDDAIGHINHYGTGHTETIITRDCAAARKFATTINAATVAINTPADPPELFTTQRTHTRGPLDPQVFTMTKQIIWASDATRPPPPPG